MIYSEDIGVEFGQEKCAMLTVKSGNRETAVKIELLNRESIRTLEEKENCKVLGDIKSEHHQTIRDEEKNKKRVPQKKEKDFRNQLCSRNLMKGIKHMDSPPCKLLGTILKMNKEGAQTNVPKDKKIDDDTQGLTSEKLHRQIVSVQKKRKRTR